MNLRKIIWPAVLALAFAGVGIGQNATASIARTEQDFAREAVERGAKAAFLDFMADGAVVFTPKRTAAKAHWMARPESSSLLRWAPNFVDSASTGKFGYSTGNWEFRPKGMDSPATGWGEFVTIWVRQGDGKYRWTIDIGVSHKAPASYSETWKTTSAGDGKTSSPFADQAASFQKIAASKGLDDAMKKYAADDIRLYRDDSMVVEGRTAAVAHVAAETGKTTYATPVAEDQSGDMAYRLTEISREGADGKSIKGNSLQVWKYRSGKWRVVLDIITYIN